MKTSVRSAEVSDSDEIRSVYIESWRAGYQGLLPPEELEIQAAQRFEFDWRRAIHSADEGVVLVAEQEDRIVGVMQVEADPKTAGRLPWIHMLYVVPAAWGSGAAQALVERAADLARIAGHDSIWLRMLEPQARARRFYEREGWRLDQPKGPASNGLFPLLYFRRGLAQ
ncbi:MAG: GNAT family N-acetyltransferase [Actinomycetota bacterium]